ncbi:UDP-3-O-(3-hydroxymyristoyl)glucosamine N-acyltransferase [Endomicrobium proavitum]|uniref:UDP-3-O-acylglucosamine N-acyltransferase n=1 Tax=Endomicrobium proavitum TaxID=1408281 RepID=A0A0G3WHM0_9BACT|nr:UDP-3-O-(3-hydroxymyristoyl)glucosamine N-acyltransferase [Endomicrobium proavitum]AKL97828.1 UDP-3-O-acylglucosamine N-acyltransferase [Endomicrobium proavitum]
MKLTASELAKIVSGDLEGNAAEIITGANGLSEARAGEVSFLGNLKYTADALNTKASVLFIAKDTDSSQFKNKTVIKVKNPQYAFSVVLTIIDKERLAVIEHKVSPSAHISQKAVVEENVYIGHNVVIEDGASVGSGTKIFPNVYIGRNVKIGKDCIIYPNAVIRENCSLGDRVILQPSVVIGGDGFGFATIDGVNNKIPQIGRVEIGSDVEIGAHTTIDRATVDATRIGDGTKIDNLVMIAHNVQIGKNCIIVAESGIAGSTQLGNNVTIGAQVGIVGHIKIGNNVTVTAQSGVTANLEDGAIVGGNPITDLQNSIKIRATLRHLPQMYHDIRKIKKDLETTKQNG